MSDEATQHTLRVQRTARYHLSDALLPGSELWYVLHGYGQLAADFIESLAVIRESNDAHLVARGRRILVAPEGLSRFYLSGTRGTIGASWMTRDFRDEEIEDYIAYLDTLHETLRAANPGKDVVFGFSQGTATASRWVAGGAVQPDVLVLWGGTVPPDISERGLQILRTIPRRIIAFGDNDRYADEDRIRQELDSLNDRDLPFEVLRFDGGHELPESALVRLLKLLGRDS